MMKDIRFYADYGSRAGKRLARKSKEPAQNVIAVLVDSGFINNGLMYETLSAVFYEPDSDVNACATSANYLRGSCKRISETVARSIHPKLFKRLDIDTDDAEKDSE